MTDRIGSRVRRLLALASRLETEVDKAALGSRPEIKIALRAEFGRIRQAVLEGRPLPRLMDTGFLVYSQNDEDGILLFLLAVCGIGTRRFVDIGAGNCLTASNCANLALNLGFHGLFIEGDARRLHEGRRTYSRHPGSAQYPPAMVEAFVTRENVDTLILDAGFSGAIDVLSIDLDATTTGSGKRSALFRPPSWSSRRTPSIVSGTSSRLMTPPMTGAKRRRGLLSERPPRQASR